MATIMFLDSNFRNNGTATDYTVSVSQTNNWPTFARLGSDTSCIMNSPGSSCLVNVIIKSLVIFYDGIAPSALVKIHFNNLETKDIHMVNTITPNTNFNFIGELRQNIAPINWYTYRCKLIQKMRLKRNGAYTFTIFDQNDNILNVGVNGRVQVTISFE